MDYGRCVLGGYVIKEQRWDYTTPEKLGSYTVSSSGLKESQNHASTPVVLSGAHTKEFQKSFFIGFSSLISASG